MPTSRPGNDSGYALLDALVSLFIAAIAAIAVYAGVAVLDRSAARGIKGAARIVEERNASVEKALSTDD